ncbi:MAG: bifunctional phosphopantothenoylcysteine decarboxylase/phosphopantothenate--cysteine ligase CoaBC, partial [Gemmatimonadales bacterium]|nr:bifunctional phosphopantothenoylcysteine decarboxylase/phosphopantothenate--cysteine ligase CoaBC [Gemmatimonadales bacterium]
ADDLLTSILLARRGPVLLAPAMNDEMYAALPTQRNLTLIRERGFGLVGPDRGALAEGPSERPGRMSEPDTILDYARRILQGNGKLAGKRVVVTAGPTREPLDLVRTITNRSSGKMGYRLARAAWYRGADVTLLSGPSAEPVPTGVRVERIETVADLERAVGAALPDADVLVMAAAPADYRPAKPEAGKRPRTEGSLTIALEPTEDVLLATKDKRRARSVIVGFALETGDPEAKGKAKLIRKDLDLIVVNDATEAGAGFEVDTNRVTIFDRDGGRWEMPLASKSEVAGWILDRVEARLG